MKRRTVVLGGIGGALGLGALLRPGDQGGDHAPYFAGLSDALDAGGLATPTLVIDRQRMLDNIITLSSHVRGRFDYRIVAKSLPSLPLLEAVMKASGSRRLMLFHQPFINQVAANIPDAEILLGKPMPVTAADNFYREFHGGGFDPGRQLIWLLDTPERLVEYRRLAESLEQDLHICVEIDVGLHRGGVTSDQQLVAMLEIIEASPRLQFRGFMGYEPHIVKIPVGDPATYRDRAMARYTHYIKAARNHLGDRWPKDVLLNAGGSPTYQLYSEGTFPFNELAAGSCLVKPTDFDLPTLADHRPASYIAAPVLKRQDGLQLPGIDLGNLQSLWNPNRANTFFTYGGYWKADLESPPGLSYNSLFGRSTNQEMVNGSGSVNLQPGDWIFLRPTQSEFVFLQFGDIAVYDRGEIVERWPVFGQAAA
jgi:D-serine deaminase-like pyridoxal phosphate-dependent protein